MVEKQDMVECQKRRVLALVWKVSPTRIMSSWHPALPQSQRLLSPLKQRFHASEVCQKLILSMGAPLPKDVLLPRDRLPPRLPLSPVSSIGSQRGTPTAHLQEIITMTIIAGGTLMFLHESEIEAESDEAPEATCGLGVHLIPVQTAMTMMAHLCIGMIGTCILHAVLIHTGLVRPPEGETLAVLHLQEVITIDREALQEGTFLKRGDLVDMVTLSDIRHHHL